jgi:GNAT superfamily N-acetyltransferase
MNEHWEVRTARAADAAQIARLSGLLGYPSDAVAILARLADVSANADHWVAVAAAASAPNTPGGALPDEGVTLGGWMHVARRITLESGEFAEILGLVVDTEARRGGVGRLLAAEAERWARLQRLGRLSVRSNIARAESHQFYPALGFARVKLQQVYSKVLGAHAAGAA